MLIIALLVSIATHYLYGGIRLQARRDKIASGAQIHLSVLLGLFMLVKAVSYWLDRYGLAMSDGDLITGITYTDANAVLPSKNILAIIALICARAVLRQRGPAELDAAGARASGCSSCRRS